MSSADWLNVVKWRIIKATGWTIEYVDSLALGKLYEIYQIEDGLIKAQV